MKKPIKFIYFDVGGVLLSWREGYKRVAKKFNVPHEALSGIFEANWAAACRGTLSNKEYMRLQNEVLHLPEPLPELTDFWTDHYPAIPEAHVLVRELARVYPLGILSNAEPGAMKYALRKGLIPSVPWVTIVDSSEHGTIKPETKIYEIAEKKSGVKPMETLFIEDMPESVEAAKNRGWHAVIFDETDVSGSIARVKKYLGM